MSSSTLYFLTVTEEWAASSEGKIYLISERHMCQEKGCVKSDKQHLKICFSEQEVNVYLKKFKNSLLEGILESVEWEPLPDIPEITNLDDFKQICGVYNNLTEMVLAMSELSGFKVYKIINDDGCFAGYTMELVE